MGEADGSESIKLVATCVKCGARLDGVHKSLCAQCRADALDDDDVEDEADEPTTAAKGAERAGESSFTESQSQSASSSKSQSQSQSRSQSQSQSQSPTASPADEKIPLHDPDVPEEYEIVSAYAECKNGRAYKVKAKSLEKELITRFFTAGVARATGGLPIEAVARLLVAQNHPNLQTVFNWHPELGTSCLILDAIPETTVETVITQEGFFDLARAIDIFIEVCEGIEELHKQGMIHGFIRPRTIGICVSETGIDTAKVTNFSITNVFSNMLDQPLKIGRNYTCHDSFYMSPEEIDGKVVDQASDVYTLGCVLFHAITGKPVYRGKVVREVLEQHQNSMPARFRKRYEIPDDVEAVVLHMIEKDPLARYKSIRSVRIDLQRIRDKKQPIIENMWRKFFGMFGGR
jgi:Protein kinase domain.